MYFFYIIIFVISLASYDFDVQNKVTDCTAYKYELANLSSNVTSCFIKYSQPLRICERCQSSFNILTEKYDEFSNNASQSYVYCKVQLFYSDILSIISELYLTFKDQWQTLNCDHCYTKNKTINPIFVKFLILEDEVMSCLANYTDSNLDYKNADFETSWWKKYFNASACSICRGSYQNVNKYYTDIESKMKKESTIKFWKGICGDMGEMMNMTRFLWSKKFNCNMDNIEWYWAIGPICTVTAMLLFFYCMVSTYFHNKIDMILYKQRRLRPMLEEMETTLLETIQ